VSRQRNEQNPTVAYNVVVEVDINYQSVSDEQFDEWHEDLGELGLVTGESDLGRTELEFTVYAENLTQAISLARTLTSDEPITRFTVESSADWDKRNGFKPDETVVSVKEAAERLGLTRQAVYKRINRGQLKAHKVGASLVVPASELVEA
jgi:excisionase family DNA binding protein